MIRVDEWETLPLLGLVATAPPTAFALCDACAADLGPCDVPPAPELDA